MCCGQVVLADVPATYLMQLDKRLAEIRQVYDAIPTLDPKTEWEAAADKGVGIYKAEDDVRESTDKKIKHKVVWEPKPNDASDRQPVIDKWSEDTIVGRWTHKNWSGMLTVTQKYELLKRLDKLQRAVKKALSAANKIEHVPNKIAATIFDFLHEGIALQR